MREKLETVLCELRHLGPLECLQAKHLCLGIENLRSALLLLLAQLRTGSTLASVPQLKKDFGSIPSLEGLNIENLCEELQLSALAAEIGSQEAPEALVWWHKHHTGTYYGFQRAWGAEIQIEQALNEIWLGDSPSPLAESCELLEDSLLALHPHQEAAIRNAVRYRMSIVSGGPGTGKTTVIRVLVATLCKVFQIPLEAVVLCAPTGRAKARMLESIQNITGKTLHSLLKYRSDGRPSFHPQSHLPYSLIVVDEASIVDSAQFANLILALGPEARIVIVGDKFQLPSVETGAVLGDFTGSKDPRLVARTSFLTKNFRSERSITEWWANYEKNPGTSLPGDPRITKDAWQGLVQAWVKESYAMCPKIKTAKDLQDWLLLGRVLVCTNHGEFGRDGINNWCRKLRNKNTSLSAFQNGEPIIVTVNQAVEGRELYNGDLGLVSMEGRKRYGLFVIQGKLEKISLDRIQGLELAYAITIHKSQGSEFNAVYLMLPEEESRMVTRQLIYTAVTRAKLALHICDPLSTLATGLREEERLTWLGL